MNQQVQLLISLLTHLDSFLITMLEIGQKLLDASITNAQEEALYCFDGGSIPI